MSSKGWISSFIIWSLVCLCGRRERLHSSFTVPIEQPSAFPLTSEGRTHRALKATIWSCFTSCCANLNSLEAAWIQYELRVQFTCQREKMCCESVWPPIVSRCVCLVQFVHLKVPSQCFEVEVLHHQSISHFALHSKHSLLNWCGIATAFVPIRPRPRNLFT